MASNEQVLNGTPTETPILLTITLENGVFQYKRDEGNGRRTCLKPGDVIQFYCEKPFAMEFKGVTPFMKLTRQPDENHKIECAVGRHANVGTYYYTIAVYDGAKVYIDDPEVVVEEAHPDNTVTGPRPGVVDPVPNPQPGP